MSYYSTRYHTPNTNRLASGLFFRVQEAEQHVQHLPLRSREVALHELGHDDFVVPEYRQTKEENELYLPLLEVSVEVEAVGTIAWTTLTQSFVNRATSVIPEATYCFPLYDNSTVTSFTCFIGSEKFLKGVVKPKAVAKADFKAAVANRRVAVLLEEHTPEVFETSIGNIPAQTKVKIEICYIAELKADLGGDGIVLTIPTSVAPRYGAPPGSLTSSNTSNPLAVPQENGLQIRIQVSSPVAINRIESRTHPVTIEIGSHGQTTTRNIRDLAKARDSMEYDPTKARATLADRSACLGKDFVLLIQSRRGTLLASRAILEPHPKLPGHSALMVSINLRDMYTPNVVSLKSPSEIIFLADRSGSMGDKIEAIKTAVGFFLKSLPSNCSFNICCFGSIHTLMWPESRSYNQENLDEAISYIADFRSDMGGTELLSALREVVKTTNPALNSQVITLTDGEVWKAADIFEFIRDSRSGLKADSTRFFALGIGDAVSHHLIEGIGRHGGGLAEVVSVDSAGEWKGRVIRMLEAALTPSTWKIDIKLGDFPEEGHDKVCVRAPHHIPDFHAFSRSSVYFLLSREVKIESVKVIASATSGEIVTADLPIQISENIRNCVHLMAVKSVLNDLESCQSWLHAAIRGEEGKNEAEIEQSTRAEGEKIGIEWSLSSRWTSFVVVDDRNSLENASRSYQAERSELAELTRPRYGRDDYQHGAMDKRLGTIRDRVLGASNMRMQDPVSGFTGPPRAGGRRAWRSRPGSTKDASTVSSLWDGDNYSEDRGYFPSTNIISTERTVTGKPEAGAEGGPIREFLTDKDGKSGGNFLKTFRKAFSGLGLSEKTEKTTEGTPTFDPQVLKAELGDDRTENSLSFAALGDCMADPAAFPSNYCLGDSMEEEPLYFSISEVVPLSRTQSLGNLKKMTTARRTASEAKDKSITTEVSLEKLVDAQTAEGSFKFSDDLSSALKSKFTNWIWGLIVEVLGEEILYEDLSAILDTARAIVFIGTMYPEIQEQWRLVVQKAVASSKR